MRKLLASVEIVTFRSTKNYCNIRGYIVYLQAMDWAELKVVKWAFVVH